MMVMMSSETKCVISEGKSPANNKEIIAPIEWPISAKPSQCNWSAN